MYPILQKWKTLYTYTLTQTFRLVSFNIFEGCWFIFRDNCFLCEFFPRALVIVDQFLHNFIHSFAYTEAEISVYICGCFCVFALTHFTFCAVLFGYANLAASISCFAHIPSSTGIYLSINAYQTDTVWIKGKMEEEHKQKKREWTNTTYKRR